MPADIPSGDRAAKHWRRLEAQARAIAAGMPTSEEKRIMLSIAEGYKRLAERAEFPKTHER